MCRHRWILRLILVAGIAGALFVALTLLLNPHAPQAAAESPPVIVVTNTNDSGPGSLRQAIAGAVAGDTIVFDPALAGATIVLQSGELVVDKDLRIEGPASQRLVVSGNHTSRVLRVTDGVSVTIASLAIMYGQATGGEITGTAGESGGGIVNAGELLLQHCIVAENAAGRGRDGSGFYPGNPIPATPGGDGGGIFSIGALTISDTTVKSNTAGAGGAGSVGCYWCSGVSGEDGGQGGGIYSAGRLFVTDSAIGQNHAGDGGHYGEGESDVVGGRGGSGGGVYTTGQMTVTRSSFVANWAGEGGEGENGCGQRTICNAGGPGGHGGGIFTAGTLSLSRTLLDSNRAGSGYTGFAWTSTDGGHGGGLCNSATARLVDAMVVSNRGGAGLRGGSGGGIYSSDRLQLERVTLQANAAGTGSHGHDGGNGGGIANSGTATIEGSIIRHNTSGIGSDGDVARDPYQPSSPGSQGGNGGGVWSSGDMALITSTLSDNGTGFGGRGGSRADWAVSYGLNGGAGGSGGGLWNSGRGTIYGCTIAYNSTGAGGDGRSGFGGGDGGDGGSGAAIFNQGTVSLSNTTISSNATSEGADGGDCTYYLGCEHPSSTAGDGGHGGHGAGIHNLAVASLTYCTIADNLTAGGGQGGASATPGVDGDDGHGGGINGSFAAINTILAGNQAAGAGPDCAGEVAAGGFDLIQNPNGCTIAPGVANTVVFASPLLGPLQVNAPSHLSSTATRALLFSSPAIDAGNCGIGAVTMDQRGVLRPQDAGCDIGAYEYEPDRWRLIWLPQ